MVFIQDFLQVSAFLAAMAVGTKLYAGETPGTTEVLLAAISSPIWFRFAPYFFAGVGFVVTVKSIDYEAVARDLNISSDGASKTAQRVRDSSVSFVKSMRKKVKSKRG